MGWAVFEKGNAKNTLHTYVSLIRLLPSGWTHKWLNGDRLYYKYILKNEDGHYIRHVEVKELQSPTIHPDGSEEPGTGFPKSATWIMPQKQSNETIACIKNKFADERDGDYWYKSVKRWRYTKYCDVQSAIHQSSFIGKSRYVDLSYIGKQT